MKPLPEALSQEEVDGGRSGNGDHVGSITEGHQIWVDRLEVAGIWYRKEAATRFVYGKAQRIEFEREPTNPYDPNAIRIVGYWKGWFSEKREHIGYIPRDVAQVVADLDLFDVIRPRLARTYLSENGYLQVFFQITGPKDGAKRFEDAVRASVQNTAVRSDYPRPGKRNRYKRDRGDYSVLVYVILWAILIWLGVS